MNFVKVEEKNTSFCSDETRGERDLYKEAVPEIAINLKFKIPSKKHISNQDKIEKSFDLQLSYL